VGAAVINTVGLWPLGRSYPFVCTDAARNPFWNFR